MSPKHPVLAAAGTAVIVGVALAGCSSNSTTASENAGVIAVTSGDDSCQVSATEAPSGTVSFAVQNTGSQVTEFYLMAEDGQEIVGEVEDIGPGLTRGLVVQAEPGSYLTSCKPGMAGDGIRAPFTVTDSGNAKPTGAAADRITAATAAYATYVRKEAQELKASTDEFVSAYLAGDADQARALYAEARTHWERIEPVAESFGDLDPKLDLREADLEPGQKWSGWHRIEKDLWPPAKYTAMTRAQREKVAKQLVADTADLQSRVQNATYTAAQLGNGAKELLDEVATSKVTGEEEHWSHTDLWDFQANVDGARTAFEPLRPVVEQQDPALARELTARFAALQSELHEHRDGDGFVGYTDLTPAQVKALAAAVDALGEPLSELTATVVS